MSAASQTTREAGGPARGQRRRCPDGPLVGPVENRDSGPHSALSGAHPSVDQAQAEIEAAREVLEDAD